MMTAPGRMAAAFIRHHGPTGNIEFGELPTPAPAAGEVLVRMDATAVNHVDLFVRSGAYATHTPFPFVIGRDMVGTVVEVGDAVDVPLASGDRVWCNSLGHAGRQGTFSEFVCVAADRLYAFPDVDPVEAVAVLHAAATAHIGLFREARLGVGDTVLVCGAGGGVGTAVVQVARAAGARVLATASSSDHDWCRAAGAEAVFDYRDPQLLNAIRDATPSGIDIWWDNSGHNDLAGSLPLLRQGGRVVLMAGMGSEPTFKAASLYTRDLSILGFAISNASVVDLAHAARSINHLLAVGKLRGRIGAVLSLAEARRAHELMEAGDHSGRIVVVPR